MHATSPLRSFPVARPQAVLVNTRPLWQGKGRCEPAILSACALWSDEPWRVGEGTDGESDPPDAVSPDLFPDLPPFLFLPFDRCYLRKAITLTSQHDWCPGQRLHHFLSQEAV